MSNGMHRMNAENFQLFEQVVTPEIAAHVLFEFGVGGYPAGSFFRALYRAMASADPQNLRRFATGFPAEHLAFTAALNTIGGVDLLRSIATSPAQFDRSES